MASVGFRVVSTSGCVQIVFLDRDGVINENRADHVKSWDEFQFIPGSREAIARLSRAGVRVFVVSNQAIVNRGLVPAAEVDAINRTMIQEIQRYGGSVEAVAYCPHRPDEDCGCRKPQPGLLLQVAGTYDLDLEHALFIGDALTDLEAGRAAGCATMLVLTGRGRDQLDQTSTDQWPDLQIAPDLSSVADLILAQAEAQPDLNVPPSSIDRPRDSNMREGSAGDLNA